MRWTLACLFLLFYSSAWPQKVISTHADSLEKQINKLKSGRAKLNAEHDLSMDDLNINAKRSLAVATMELAEARKFRNDSAISVACNDIGECYFYLSDFKKASASINQSYRLAMKIGYKRQMALSLLDMSSVYANQSDYVNSQALVFKALAIYEQLKDDREVAVCNYNIGVIYDNHEDFDKAIFYGKKVLQFKPATSAGFTVLANGNLLVGDAYANSSSNVKAKFYYSRALQIFQQQKNDFGKATVLSVLFSTYPGQYQKQIELGLKAQELWNRLGPDNFYSIYNLGNIGSAYGRMAATENTPGKRKDLLKKAESYLSGAISGAKRTNNKSAIIDFSDSLSAINAKSGEFEQAYLNLKTSSKLYDSVYSQKNKNKMASIEEKHEIQLKDNQLLINNLRLANKEKQTWFLAGGLLMLLLFAGLVYSQSLQRKKTNIALQQLNDQLGEANKVKNQFFGILNHDLRAPIANFLNFLHLKKDAPDLVVGIDNDAFTAKATTAAENLLNTMEDLLLWSKGQMENFKPDIKSVPVDELFTYIKESAHVSNISFIFSGDSQIILNTDEHYIKPIMFNLTNNAMKAMKDMPGAVIEWNAWEDQHIKYLSITDNGAGASAAAFRSLYDDTAPVGIKSGLGLHIVRDLAKAINCRVEVLNNTSAGVKIRIAFG